MDVKHSVQTLSLANVTLSWVRDTLLGQAIKADGLCQYGPC
jgi:hypothetical protein